MDERLEVLLNCIGCSPLTQSQPKPVEMEPTPEVTPEPEVINPFASSYDEDAEENINDLLSDFAQPTEPQPVEPVEPQPIEPVEPVEPESEFSINDVLQKAQEATTLSQTLQDLPEDTSTAPVITTDVYFENCKSNLIDEMLNKDITVNGLRKKSQSPFDFSFSTDASQFNLSEDDDWIEIENDENDSEILDENTKKKKIFSLFRR